MLKRIVVPLDGTALGEAAVPYAVALSRRSGAALNLVHVHRARHPTERLEALPQYRFQQVDAYGDARDGEALKRTRARLDALAEQIRAEGDMRIVVRVLEGPVGERLQQFLKSIPPTLVVMSTTGQTGRWPLHERVHEAVVTRGGAPVLLIQESDRPGRFEGRNTLRMLVALDGSSFAEKIIQPAAELARTLDADVTLLRVVIPFRFDIRAVAAPGAIDRQVESARNYLEAVARRVSGLSRPVKVRVGVRERPAPAIVEAAEAGEFDLVALATHGHGGAHHLLVGSVADQVIREAKVPVLVTRPSGVEVEMEPVAGMGPA
jgi:nucleotide-binding universal stress UspA family protein